MSVKASGHFIAFGVLFILQAILGQDDNQMPKELVKPLAPLGLEILIPNDPSIIKVNIIAIIKKGRSKKEDPKISGQINKPTNGFWTLRDNSLMFQIGDIIECNIFFYRNDKPLIKRQVYYMLTASDKLEELAYSKTTPDVTTPTPSTECRQSPTSILSPKCLQSLCSGQIIFEDNFDTISEDLWTIEEYIPSKPEYPFVSYQRPTVSVHDGILRITPQLQENMPGFDSATILDNTLDLSLGCTRPGSCVFCSENGYILPPIASGRITSKMFSFKYGSVEVKARVPQGDWLYPDILLESLLNKYGNDDYASGVLKIAGVLGNFMLKKGSEEYGNKVLYGGPVMDFKCRSNLLLKKFSNAEWGNDFHVYLLRWAPDIITLSVDGEEWGRIEAPSDGLQTHLHNETCDLLHRIFLKTPMAPFDDYFNIVLGVSAGGVSEFPDGVVSLFTHRKPWINNGRRARLDFFTAKESWLPTWTQPALLVDYIKVRAL